jgi:hypothetical protein
LFQDNVGRVRRALVLFKGQGQNRVVALWPLLRAPLLHDLLVFHLRSKKKIKEGSKSVLGFFWVACEGIDENLTISLKLPWM